MRKRFLALALAFALCMGMTVYVPQTAHASKTDSYEVLWQDDIQLFDRRLIYMQNAYENTLWALPNTRDDGLYRFDGRNMTRIMEGHAFDAGYTEYGITSYPGYAVVNDEGLFLAKDEYFIDNPYGVYVADYTGRVLTQKFSRVETSYVPDGGWIVVRDDQDAGSFDAYAYNIATGEKKDTKWRWRDYEDCIVSYNNGIYSLMTSRAPGKPVEVEYYNDQKQGLFEGISGWEFNNGYALAEVISAESNAPIEYVILSADGSVAYLPENAYPNVQATIWKDQIISAGVSGEGTMGFAFYDDRGNKLFDPPIHLVSCGEFRNGYVEAQAKEGFTILNSKGEVVLSPGTLERQYGLPFWACSNVTTSGLIWVQLHEDWTDDYICLLLDLDGSANNHFDGTPSQPGNDTTPAPTDAPAASAPASPTSFPDVKPGDWFYDCVMDMVSMGAVSGLPDGTFAPNQTITTGELITLAMNLMPGKKLEDMYTQQEIEDFKNTPGAPDLSGYWAGDTIIEAMLTRGMEEYLTAKDLEFWTDEIYRISTIELIYYIYNNSDIADGNSDTSAKSYSLIGDVGRFKPDYRAPFVYWAYNNGIVTGINARGDFGAFETLTRAEACGILSHVIHPETRAKVDWDHVRELDALLEDPNALHRLPDGVDCFGNTRIHYAEDAAYDFCRIVEEKIGIPIYYLPEFTDKGGPVTPEGMAQNPISKLYFDDIFGELGWLNTAINLLPEGMIKEVAGKKYHKNTEIILTRYCAVPGASQFGCYQYDYSDDPVKVDQIFYTGEGDIHFYLHELGHMVTGSMGGNAFNSAWEELYNNSSGFVGNGYAATGPLEDIAETWAYLWEAPDEMMDFVRQDMEPMLIKKYQLLTDMLDEKLETFDAATAPWAEILSEA